MEINDKYEVLKRLKHLLDTGVLTLEEFNKEKAKILGDSTNSFLTDEQKAQLRKIEALKDAGILNEREYQEQKRAILSTRQQYRAEKTYHSAKQTNTADNSSSSPKKKKSTLWIILGVVASIVVIALIAGGTSGDYSGGYNGLMGNPYSAIDDYVDNTMYYERKGNAVYYYDWEDLPGEGIIGSVLQNPNSLDIFGDGASEIGRNISGAFREEVLSSRMKEDYALFQLISSNNLSFYYVWNGKQLYVYSPEEIRMKL